MIFLYRNDIFLKAKFLYFIYNEVYKIDSRSHCTLFQRQDIQSVLRTDVDALPNGSSYVHLPRRVYSFATWLAPE